ncbi:hypothetical protein [Bradyrhizobium oligotrophicum]|uniref:hypothetical protein n=1 Tax=Bradyrhizobium oligotrophicum TaxID=44255 RepID=UPI003EB94BFF
MNYADEESYAKFVRAIANHVRCEVQRAVALEYTPDNPNRAQLFDWAAKVALTVRAVDKGTANPGLSVFNTSGLFTMAAGGQLETDGTREMTMTYFLPFNELLNNGAPPKQKRQIDYESRELPCDNFVYENGVREPIAGNLGLHESFVAALNAWDARNTLSERVKGGPFDTITHHVTFVVIAGASGTPTWKFANVTANTTSPFLSATRTNTDELLITIGPGQLGSRKELNESFFVERLRSVVGRQ